MGLLDTIGIHPIALVAGLGAAANVTHDHPLAWGLSRSCSHCAYVPSSKQYARGLRINPTIVFASVATVDRITTAPCASRALTTRIA